MANSQEEGSSQHPDLLAAVVLHTLVSEGRDGMTVAAVALACERDPYTQRDIDEIVVALEILQEDGLAEREAAPGHKPRATCKSTSTHGAGIKRRLDATQVPNTTQAPDTPFEPMYRPTRAAIRANELSF